MPTFSIYDNLLRFTLFQGMSRSDLLSMVGHTRFGFTKLSKGKSVVKEGDRCDMLWFLVNGRLQTSRRSVDASYLVVEHFSAPFLLQPESLFGFGQRYTCDCKTESDCQFITLAKQEVEHLSEQYLVFRLNLLGLLATQSQRLLAKPWRRATPLLRDRLIRFITDRCSYPAGAKEIYVLMTRLAKELCASRQAVSDELNRLQDRQLVQLSRGCIAIPMLEKLIMAENG